MIPAKITTMPVTINRRSTGDRFAKSSILFAPYCYSLFDLLLLQRSLVNAALNLGSKGGDGLSG